MLSISCPDAGPLPLPYSTNSVVMEKLVVLSSHTAIPQQTNPIFFFNLPTFVKRMNFGFHIIVHVWFSRRAEFKHFIQTEGKWKLRL